MGNGQNGIPLFHWEHERKVATLVMCRHISMTVITSTAPPVNPGVYCVGYELGVLIRSSGAVGFQESNVKHGALLATMRNNLSS